MVKLPRKSVKKTLEQCYEDQAMIITDMSDKLAVMEEYLRTQDKLITGYKQYASIRASEGNKSETKHRNKSKYFHKSYTTELIKLINSKTLTAAQQRILFCTTPFLEKETNFILNNDKQRASKEDILKIIDMDKKTFDKALNGLQDMGIMFKITISKCKVNFVINAKYFYIGEDNEIWADNMYIKELLNPSNVSKDE